MPELWDQVKTILANALEQPAEQREDFVRLACGDDLLLRREVESLLAHHDQADSLLENSPVRGLIAPDAASWSNRRLGAYRILREIGHGGMAVVYLAERNDEEFYKQVAIKMLKPGLQTAEILQRFRNERQTLAALDHPYIVKLLDGGSTEGGLPFLVMDYVSGSPIDRFCEEEKLDVRRRLELFLQVCSAVEYAHGNQVVHRDLKPANVLVTPQGVPRLLDFGIAKLLNPDCLDTPLSTGTGWRPMTPEYASPEQILGAAVDDSSDVYSLGVMLYELLAGQRPFREAEGSRLELERAICEQEPQRPSRIARMSARDLRPFDGDLDTIILKALSKEPERRYSSVAEFSADLERHLAGRPVQARNPTLSYRVGRFLRRHRESVTTAAAVLIMAAAIGIWQLRRAPVHATVAVQPPARRSVAILGFKNLTGRAVDAWLSTALSEMVAGELAAGEQLRVVPRETVARTKADLGLQDIERVPDDALARVRQNLDSDWIAVGSYSLSGRIESRQVSLNVRLQNSASGETVAAASDTDSDANIEALALRTGSRIRERLGLAALSDLESRQVKASFPSLPEVIRLYSQGLDKLSTMDALAARDLLSQAVAAEPGYPLAHAALATAWITLGYDANAREQAKLALDTAQTLSREDHLLVEARYFETLKNWRKAIETYQLLASSFPDIPEYALSLAGAQASGGKGKDALHTLQTLGERDAAARDDPRIDLGMALAAAALGDSVLRRDAAERAAQKAQRQGAKLLEGRARSLECRALANLGELDRAKKVCEEGRRIFSEAGDRAGLARALHAMAELPLDQGDLAAAEDLYRQALTLMRQTGYQQGVATELVNLGLIAAKQGKFAAAHQMYSESFHAYERTGDQNGMAVAAGNLGNLLRAEGKLPDALASYRRSQALSDAVGNRSATAHALENIGGVLADQGNFPEAHKMFEQALEIQQERGEKSAYAETLVTSGQAYLEQGETERASKLFEQALSLQSGLKETGSAAETRLAQAELARNTGKPEEAERLARLSLAEFDKQKEPDKVMFAQAALTRALLQEQKLREAGEVLQPALEKAHSSLNQTIRQSVDLAHAELLAAANSLEAAESAARRVAAQTAAINPRMNLEASLVRAEIQLKRNPLGGRERLHALAKSARSSGFELIARRASALAE